MPTTPNKPLSTLPPVPIVETPLHAWRCPCGVDRALVYVEPGECAILCGRGHAHEVRT